jgi:hypothetical protein
LAVPDCREKGTAFDAFLPASAFSSPTSFCIPRFFEDEFHFMTTVVAASNQVNLHTYTHMQLGIYADGIDRQDIVE